MTENCKHTECPKCSNDYIKWHEWAEKMSKTHDQFKCSHCGLYAVWKKREDTVTEILQRN